MYYIRNVFFINYFAKLCVCVQLKIIRNRFTDIFQTMFGLPSQCVHHNVIHPCKLSFSCWLQGGIHATGCGSKWLFSCCVTENGILPASEYGTRNQNVLQPANLKFYRKNVLRRRTDELNQVNLEVNFINTYKK